MPRPFAARTPMLFAALLLPAAVLAAEPIPDENKAKPVSARAKPVVVASAAATATATPVETGATPVVEAKSEVDPLAGHDFSVSVGVGVQELLHGEVSYLPNRYFTVGLGVGGFPSDSLLSTAMGVDDLSASANLPHGLKLSGTASSSLVSAYAFGRWSPWGKAFYVHGALALWFAGATADGVVSHGSYPSGIPVSVSANVVTPILDFKMGWRARWESGVFVDFSLGVNVLLPQSANVSVDSPLESDPNAAAAANAAEQYLAAELTKGVDTFMDKVPVLPSMALRVGWTFDAF